MSHTQTTGSAAVDIGSRLELLLDDFLIQRMDGATLTLHQPAPQEVAIVHDQPWEGNTSYYHTVFRDGDLIRFTPTRSNPTVERPTSTLASPNASCPGAPPPMIATRGSLTLSSCPAAMG